MGIEHQYMELIKSVLETGDEKGDRTGTGTLSTFGAILRADLSDGSFPALTSKRVYWKTAIKEMLWFLKGETNIKNLLKENVSIWSDWPHAHYEKTTGKKINIKDFEQKILESDEFAKEWGELGPVYGKQWRKWASHDGKVHDQIGDLIEMIKNEPNSRRLLFHGWNVAEVNQMALPPCHLLYQYNVTSDGKLNSAMYQRSCDLFLGLPFNLVGQAALQAMIAQQTGLKVGKLIWIGGDTHIYLNHQDQIKEQLKRQVLEMPKLKLNKRNSIDEYVIEDFVIEDYNPGQAIQGPVAV